MPIYEYECLSCSTRSEVIQRFNDPPLETCGDCGGELKKLISAPAFQFKGDGWYVTDYARKDDKKNGKGKAEAKASDGAKSGGGSEKKADTAKTSSPAKPASVQAKA